MPIIDSIRRLSDVSEEALESCPDSSREGDCTAEFEFMPAQTSGPNFVELIAQSNVDLTPHKRLEFADRVYYWFAPYNYRPLSSYLVACNLRTDLKPQDTAAALEAINFDSNTQANMPVLRLLADELWITRRQWNVIARLCGISWPPEESMSILHDTNFYEEELIALGFRSITNNFETSSDRILGIISELPDYSLTREPLLFLRRDDGQIWAKGQSIQALNLYKRRDSATGRSILENIKIEEKIEEFSPQDIERAKDAIKRIATAQKAGARIDPDSVFAELDGTPAHEPALRIVDRLVDPDDIAWFIAGANLFMNTLDSVRNLAAYPHTWQLDPPGHGESCMHSFYERLEKRARHEPFVYLQDYVPFYSTDTIVRESALSEALGVPTSPTAYIFGFTDRIQTPRRSSKYSGS